MLYHPRIVHAAVLCPVVPFCPTATLTRSSPGATSLPHASPCSSAAMLPTASARVGHRTTRSPHAAGSSTVSGSDPPALACGAHGWMLLLEPVWLCTATYFLTAQSKKVQGSSSIQCSSIQCCCTVRCSKQMQSAAAYAPAALLYAPPTVKAAPSEQGVHGLPGRTYTTQACLS